MSKLNEFQKWMAIVRGADSEQCDCGDPGCDVCYPNDIDEDALFDKKKTVDYMQSVGLSHDDKEYDVDFVPDDEVYDVYDRVTGDIAESNKSRSMRARQLTEQGSVRLVPTLYEKKQWDKEISRVLGLLFEQTTLVESTLSRLIGKMEGGQKLVSWLHRRHRLDNEADLEPAPFDHRLLWKEFKRNPDNFVIVSAARGVAAIKPYESYITSRAAEYAERGRVYNPSTDNTIPYQIVAFTAEGDQINPALLRPEGQGGTGEYKDPTVTKARMGLHHGKDTQNPDNVFNLLADQIGRLLTVWVTGADTDTDDELYQRAWKKGAVPREKMSTRKELHKPYRYTYETALQVVFNKIKPVLSTLANQALSNIDRQIQEFSRFGDISAVKKLENSSQKLNSFISYMSANTDVMLGKEVIRILKQAIAEASQTYVDDDEYKEYVMDLAQANTGQLKPVLDSIRRRLVSL